MIRVELRDRSNALVKVLSKAKKARYHQVLNQDGAGSFQIHRGDPDFASLGMVSGGIDGYIVHLLRKGPLETAFTDRFSFVVESVLGGVDYQEDAGAWFTVAGRGTLCLLEDRLAFPPGFDGVTPSTISAQWQNYTLQPGGAIMDAEIDRSASRFSVALTHTIQQSTVQQTASLRFDNLRKLHDYLVTNGPMDAQMLGVDYQAFDRQGTDKSATVKVQLGPQDSLLALQLERDSRPVKNWVIAQGTGEGINAKLAISTDATSIASLRRREGFVDSRQTSDQAQLGRVAAGAITQYKAVAQRITVKYSDSTHAQVYRDFVLGDTVGFACAPLSWSSPFRVVGIQVADTDKELDDVSLDLNDVRLDYLLRAQKGATLTADSMNVLNRQPQGAPFNDSQTYPDDCDGTHPFHFDLYLPSNLLRLNYGKLSFKLRAFRSPVAGAATVSSGASSASSSGSSSSVTSSSTGADHTHHVSIAAVTSTLQPVYLTLSNLQSAGGPLNVGTSLVDSSTVHTHDNPHTHDISHTHQVTPSLTYGIFESTVATGVLVIVNGIDRTTALGGGAGFTADQTELEISQWLNIGQWNTVDLQSSGNGRIVGSLRVTGYVQSS